MSEKISPITGGADLDSECADAYIYQHAREAMTALNAVADLIRQWEEEGRVGNTAVLSLEGRLDLAKDVIRRLAKAAGHQL